MHFIASSVIVQFLRYGPLTDMDAVTPGVNLDIILNSIVFASVGRERGRRVDAKKSATSQPTAKHLPTMDEKKCG